MHKAVDGTNYTSQAPGMSAQQTKVNVSCTAQHTDVFSAQRPLGSHKRLILRLILWIKFYHRLMFTLLKVDYASVLHQMAPQYSPVGRVA